MSPRMEGFEITFQIYYRCYIYVFLQQGLYNLHNRAV